MSRSRFDPLVASFVLATLLFLGTLPLPRVDGWIIGSDGLFYYSILRSAVHDRDLDFGNEYARLGAANMEVTATGLRTSPYAIGCPILWSPFYLAAHAVGAAVRATGGRAPADGYGPIDQTAVCLGSLFYGAAGLLLARRLGRRLAVASERGLDLALTTALWATPAIYYLVAEPSMSHGVTLFTVTLFFSAWLPAAPQRSPRRWLLIGLAAGLAALVRWQDGVVLALPVGEILLRLRSGTTPPRGAAGALLAVGAGFVLAFSPQLLMWKEIYGQLLLVPQGEGFMRWTQPSFLGTLFSARHGLISWHPWFLLALASLPALARRRPALGWGLAGLFALSWYVNAAVHWWPDDGFGGRRYIGLVPVLGLALAAGLAAPLARGGRARHATILLLVGLVGWNALSALQYRLGVVPRNEALTLRQMTIDRVVLPFELVARRLDRGRP